MLFVVRAALTLRHDHSAPGVITDDDDGSAGRPPTRAALRAIHWQTVSTNFVEQPGYDLCMAFWYRDAEAWVRRGEQLERQSNQSGAEEAYRQADAAGSAEGAANLGMLLYERGAVDESRAALTRADERGSATGTFRLGFLQDEQGAAADAEAIYRRAVERGDCHAANNLAVMLSRRGDWSGAREMYQRLAQSSDPQSAAKGAPDRRRRRSGPPAAAPTDRCRSRGPAPGQSARRGAGLGQHPGRPLMIEPRDCAGGGASC